MYVRYGDETNEVYNVYFLRGGLCGVGVLYCVVRLC
jgi:hypothetical protein